MRYYHLHEVVMDYKDEFKNYVVLHDGRVFSKKRGIFLKPSGNNSGYLHVVLMENGVRHTRRVHRLVAKKYIPNHNGYHEINHKNGIKTDNRFENLEWCTASQNIQHAYKIGTRKILRGEKSHYFKLTDKKVKEIMELYYLRINTQKELGVIYGVSSSTIGLITRRKNWSHIKEPKGYNEGIEKIKKGLAGEKNIHSKLKEKDVIEIRKLYSSGDYTQEQIGLKYKISRPVISQIVTKKTWRHIL